MRRLFDDDEIVVFAVSCYIRRNIKVRAENRIVVGIIFITFSDPSSNKKEHKKNNKSAAPTIIMFLIILPVGYAIWD